MVDVGTLERDALHMPLGATIDREGVSYRVWAPKAGQIEAEIVTTEGDLIRTVELKPRALGYHYGVDHKGKAGDLYRFRLNGRGAFPDPASRFQPQGVHGPSEVIDPSVFQWTDQGWEIPPLRDFVIYELHIGTFTKEGTYFAAALHLPYLADLGVTAIELMPVAEFAGARNWGYDGTYIFAPTRVYGRPDDLRAFVDQAHRHGLAVVIDLVYGHFGPDGCYVSQFADAYFDPSETTPWGAAINFGGPNSGHVREFYLSNVRYWIQDFHFDAFRLDATHAMIDRSSRHILADIAGVAHASKRYVIAEDERNDAGLLSPREEGGYELDAVWADDFHHTVESAIVDASSYKADFIGELHEIIDALRHGWLYRGQYNSLGTARGTECAHLPLTAFVFCISNHDQAGNRAFGERMSHLVKPDTYRTASTLLCLCPYLPLLFMGQEWATSAPFLYFTDHTPELGRAIETGRIREIRRRRMLAGPQGLKEIPSPQAKKTFEDSILDWDEAKFSPHYETLALYRELLRLRKAEAAFRPLDRVAIELAALQCGVGAIRYRDITGDWLLLIDLNGHHSCHLTANEIGRLNPGEIWKVHLSSNEKRFGGEGAPSFDPQTAMIYFQKPEALLLKAE